MKIKKLGTLLIGVLMFGLVSCEYQTIDPNEVVVPVGPVSFTGAVEPIFQDLNCIMCHSGSQKPDLRTGKAYASLTGNNLVVAGDADGSKLFQYITSGHQFAKNMNATQKALIEKWIKEGAKNN